MKIDAVTVSIDYSDYLQKIISNKELLDNWLIVTHKDDKKTIKVCKDNKLNFIYSQKIYENAVFAKSKAINEGLEHLNPDDWILQLDSDAKLPDNFKTVISENVKNKNIIYGSRRYDDMGNDIGIITGMPYKGAVGFFQLWHSSAKNRYTLTEHTNAEGDVDHDQSFEDRCILPLHIIDVQDKRTNKRVNWYGRGIIGKTRHTFYK